MGAFLIGLSAINLFYHNRTVSSIYLADIKIANLKRERLAMVVEQTLAEYAQKPLVIEVSDSNCNCRRELQTTLSSLGLTFNAEVTVDHAWRIGKSGIWGPDLLSRANLFSAEIIEPSYDINWVEFYGESQRLLSDYRKEPSDATIFFDNGWQIKPEKSGYTFDLLLFVGDLRDRVNRLSTESILASVVEDNPKVSAVGAKRALGKVESLSNQKIILSFGQDSWQLSGANLFSILRFSPQGLSKGYLLRLETGQAPISVIEVRTVDSSSRELDVGLDGLALSDFVSKIAKSINQDRIDAEIVIEGDRVKEFTPARDGQNLDVTLTKQAIIDAVSIERVGGEGNININLPVAVSKAKVEGEEIERLGIGELIGRGVSYFAGSIANRVHNLTLGSRRVNGTLVAPGEAFSFNRSVGEVSGTTGYKQAYVISEGRTVLDDGGGICQVSTTIFRAVLNAGLPIVARTAHAYRVAYYEQRGFVPGFDATVWAPAVDFVFKNDTDHHILVQASVDPADSKLQVDIYGTGDGRGVEISNPTLTNYRDAPPDKYQEDQTLPKGTVKQIDFKAQGVTAVFTRKVYKHNKLIISDSFKSNFRPWQAVYLVGTM